ncbi:MAG TPA: FecR domain-containing protein [Burkholderiaceae bacterium]|nr:FecR domain-containing protein [Burkholderiaceae bacterium]
MSPPISKDWWLAAALTSATLPAALAQPASADRRQSGVVTTAVTQGAERGSSSAPIYVEGTRGQRLSTGPNQSLHVLFSDQSAMTLGPNSELVIAEYRYDTQSKSGALLVQMAKGLLRVVGGLVSKQSQTTVATPTSTIGIRGGISLVEVNEQGTTSSFLFGSYMRVASGDGSSSETITRPGFGTRTGSSGVQPPERTGVSQLNDLLARFESGQPRPQPPGQPQLSNLGLSQLGQVAFDRLPAENPLGNTPGVPRGSMLPQPPMPTLEDILGSQAPGNQS